MPEEWAMDAMDIFWIRIFFGVKRGREEEEEEEGGRERRNQGSQSASAPKWVRIFFPLFSLREMVSIEIKTKVKK